VPDWSNTVTFDGSSIAPGAGAVFSTAADMVIGDDSSFPYGKVRGPGMFRHGARHADFA
jgi:hypothetical protein